MIQTHVWGLHRFTNCGGKVFPFIENAEETLTKHTMLRTRTTFWTEHFACYKHNLIPFSASISMCAFYVLGVQQTHSKQLLLWFLFNACRKMNLWSNASNTTKTTTTYTMKIAMWTTYSIKMSCVVGAVAIAYVLQSLHECVILDDKDAVLCRSMRLNSIHRTKHFIQEIEAVKIFSSILVASC